MSRGLLLLCLAPALAHAQVNTERLRNDPKPGFHGQVEGSLDLRTGNSPQLGFGISTRLELNAEKVHRGFVVGSYEFGQKGDERENYLNRSFGHIRWTAMWHDRIGSEVFGQLQADEFLRLELRILGGAGARAVLVAHEVVDVIAGLGAMIEVERLNLAADNSHPDRSVNPRLTSYVLIRARLDDRLAVSSTTYVQPRMDAFDDFRILEEAAIEVALTTQLSLIVAFTLTHDSQPPDGVDRTDTVFAPRLRVQW